MKQQVNPIVAIGIAAVVFIAAVFFIMRGTGSPTAAATDKPSMPADVSAEFNKRMGGMQNGGGAPIVPGKSNGGGMPQGGMPGYMSPPK